VTNEQFYPNVREVISDLPDIAHVLMVDRSNEETPSHRHIDYWPAMEKASSYFSVEEMGFDDLAIIQYTSGSTGMPKGAMWSNKTISAIRPFLLYALGLETGEMVWGPADPGWAYGLVASILGPLSMHATVILCEIPFDPESYYQIMEKYKVAKFLYAPVAYRHFLAAGDELKSKYDIHLKAACSGGEPLNPEVLAWFEKNFGTKIYDGYGCTETSMTISNLSKSSMPVKPGSMGLPLPGVEIALRDESGNPVPAGRPGIICYNTDSPSNAFLGYLDEPEKTKNAFIHRTWFKTGDLALRDEDGYYFFQGRNDDIIKSSGYRIGPFEIESTLAEHPAVAEAAVIGVPDPVKKEAIVAYVQLTPPYHPDSELADELIRFVKQRLAKHQTPQRIVFLDALPRNPSGKVLRYQLRADTGKP
jgi:acetyl-CoA synthetase